MRTIVAPTIMLPCGKLYLQFIFHVAKLIDTLERRRPLMRSVCADGASCKPSPFLATIVVQRTAMKMLQRIIGLTVALLLPSATPAGTATIFSSRDTTIYQANPNNSNGAGPYMYVGTNANSTAS